MRKIIPYGRQDISDEDIQSVVETLKSDFIAQGPKVEEFEKKFAEFCGVRYALACSNGTAALHLSVLALSENRKGKVLTTPITFAASSNAALYCGLEVEFVDIDEENYNIDLDLLEAALKKNPNSYQGVIPVSYAGYPIDTERLSAITKKYNLWTIEDSCHSTGAQYVDSKGRKQTSGNARFTDIGTFSFHPVKHLACGEGGMITTNNEKLFEKLSMLRTHGITKDPSFYVNKNESGWYHEMQSLGFNYRMTDIHAALGVSQLKRITNNLEKRNQIASDYFQFLKNLPLELPEVPKHIYHAYHLFVIQTDLREELYNYLRYRGIICQVHYIPVYHHPYYQNLGYKKGLCPKAERFYSRCLSLPIYPSLSNNDYDFIIDTINKFYLTR